MRIACAEQRFPARDRLVKRRGPVALPVLGQGVRRRRRQAAPASPSRVSPGPSCHNSAAMSASRRWCGAPTVRKRNRSRCGPVRASPGRIGASPVQGLAAGRVEAAHGDRVQTGGIVCSDHPRNHAVAPADVLEAQRHAVCLVAVNDDRQALRRSFPMVLGERHAVERSENVDEMIRERNGRRAEGDLRHVMVGPGDADVVGVDVEKRLGA